MKILNYVKRCKYSPKRTDRVSETFETVHAAGNNETFCGKELNEMWYIISSSGMSIEDVTCKNCIKVIKNGDDDHETKHAV